MPPEAGARGSTVLPLHQGADPDTHGVGGCKTVLGRFALRLLCPNIVTCMGMNEIAFGPVYSSPSVGWMAGFVVVILGRTSR